MCDNEEIVLFPLQLKDDGFEADSKIVVGL